MRGDEARVIASFGAWLRAEGWSVEQEVDFCDVVARRDGVTMFAEAKGETEAVGLDVDTLYGQLLRRMPISADESFRFAVVVPTRALEAALRVSERARTLLRITVFEVTAEGAVREATTPSSTVRVAGIDGTKGGWVAVELVDGRFSGSRVFASIETRFEELEDVAVLAIDVPVGFGPRQADAAARRYLRGAASTVFTTPTREVIEVPFGPGRGLSAQSHALGPRILHATALAGSESRLREVHPEVSFRAMNGDMPFQYRKKSAGGVLERLELLGEHGIELTDLDSAALVPVDDVLDAAAAAWSAHRIARGLAKSLPDPPEVVDGRLVAIWY